MDDIKSLVNSFLPGLERARPCWLARMLQREDITFNGPGGIAGKGIQESVFTGTRTETFRVPNSEDIPATGKKVSLPYTLGLTYRDGKWSSFRLIFDRAELMSQLGLIPA